MPARGGVRVSMNMSRAVGTYQSGCRRLGRAGEGWHRKLMAARRWRLGRVGLGLLELAEASLLLGVGGARCFFLSRRLSLLVVAAAARGSEAAAAGRSAATVDMAAGREAARSNLASIQPKASFGEEESAVASDGRRTTRRARVLIPPWIDRERAGIFLSPASSKRCFKLVRELYPGRDIPRSIPADPG